MNELHWKTSEIARDPLLGDKNYFYLTSHSKDFLEIWKKMENARDTLIQIGVPVIREKIELIIYDTKMKGIK